MYRGYGHILWPTQWVTLRPGNVRLMRRKGTGLTAQGKYTVSPLASNAVMATASQPSASPTQSWIKRLYLKEETVWLNSEVWHMDWDNSELDIYTKPPSILGNLGVSSDFPMSLWKSLCPLSPLLYKTSSTCEFNIYHLEMKWLAFFGLWNNTHNHSQLRGLRMSCSQCEDPGKLLL